MQNNVKNLDKLSIRPTDLVPSYIASKLEAYGQHMKFLRSFDQRLDLKMLTNLNIRSR